LLLLNIKCCHVDCERVQLGDGALSTIMETSCGDMRKAVTYLQSSHQLSGKGNVVTSECVLEITGQVYVYTSLLDGFRLSRMYHRFQRMC
jgi:hypothetical protein